MHAKMQKIFISRRDQGKKNSTSMKTALEFCNDLNLVIHTQNSFEEQNNVICITYSLGSNCALTVVMHFDILINEHLFQTDKVYTLQCSRQENKVLFELENAL